MSGVIVWLIAVVGRREDPWDLATTYILISGLPNII